MGRFTAEQRLPEGRLGKGTNKTLIACSILFGSIDLVCEDILLGFAEPEPPLLSQSKSHLPILRCVEMALAPLLWT